MTPDEVFVTAISKSLGKADKKQALMDLASMCVALVRRVERLEQRPELQFCGVWQADAGVYPEGSAVTFGGSLWVATRLTRDRPATDDSGWVLTCKRGRDGRDGKDARTFAA